MLQIKMYSYQIYCAISCGIIGSFIVLVPGRRFGASLKWRWTWWWTGHTAAAATSTSAFDVKIIILQLTRILFLWLLSTAYAWCILQRMIRGSTPKHTIYAFIICSQVCATFVFAMWEKNEKRGRVWPIFKKKCSNNNLDHTKTNWIIRHETDFLKFYRKSFIFRCCKNANNDAIRLMQRYI